MNERKRKDLILIGGGNRGKRYTDIAASLDGCYRVVAVAEPIRERREDIARIHNIPPEHVYESWEALLAKPRFADAAIIATMDRDHFAPALQAIRQGYPLLLEKPVSPDPGECRLLEEEARRYGVPVLVCHVLRYTPFFRALRELIDRGEIGEVVNIQHAECVGTIHQSHSFVRGNWCNSRESSPMLLQKSCHDIDILQWLLGERRCLRVQSFGSLRYFTPENAPEGAPEFCIDGCPVGDTCPYNAVKLYLKSDSDWFRTTATHLPHPEDADVERAIRTTDYGRCVFGCHNDVVDHQVVNMEFEGGATVSFTMCAFTYPARRIRIMGTLGEISAQMDDPEIQIFDFQSGKTRRVEVSGLVRDDSINGGHGGGDGGIMRAFYRLLCGEAPELTHNLTESCESHRIVFAAEKSRLTSQVVEMESFSL